MAPWLGFTGTGPAGNDGDGNGDAERGTVLTRAEVGAGARQPTHSLGERSDGELVELRDGSRAVLRMVRSSDGPLLLDGFARLSPHSRRMRFLIGKNMLSAKELRYFTDIDHHDHEAIGALDAISGRGIGIARYIRAKDDPLSAEVAITVVDEWQRRGLGLELMRRLARRALDEHIRYFRALTDADNTPAVALLRRMDADVELISFEMATVEYEVSLRSVVGTRR